MWLSSDQDSTEWQIGKGISGQVRTTLGDNDLFPEINGMISQCSDRLHMMTPIMNDPYIVDSLCEARRRGVIVKLITPLTDKDGEFKTKGWDASGESLAAHHEAIRTLARSGVILMSTATLPHAKLILADNDTGYFGSANMTKNSLRGESVEVGILINEKNLISNLKAAFEEVWSECCFELGFVAEDIGINEFSMQRETNRKDTSRYRFHSDGLTLFLSRPGGAPAISDEISKRLRHARKSVLLVAMSFYDVEQIPLFGEELASCLDRGIQVKIVVRPEHFELEKYPEPGTVFFLNKGAELLGYTGLHAKGFVIDDDWCGIQSANFNPFSLDPEKAADGKKVTNVEMAIIGDTQIPVINDLTRFFRTLADNPTHRFSR